MHPERDFIPRKRPGNFVAGMLVPAMPSIVIKRVLLGCLLSALLFGIVAISETASSSGTLGINLFGNGSFETPRADGALPEGWSLAYGSQVEPPPVAYPDVSQPEWAGDPGPRTGDRYLQFIVDPSAESRTELVRDDLVPVKSDTDYRLQMAYRFQEVDETAENIHLSRLWFGVRHYYDANPGGEPDPQLFEPQIDYVDSLCCGSLAPAEKTQWTLVEENIRFESAGYDVDGVLRQVAWIQVYLLTNDWFRGTLAVDDVSLVELASAVIEPPASSLAFDFVPRVCDAASENAGTACVIDGDCPGKDTNDDGEPDTEGSCVAPATAGFTAVPFNRQFSAEGGFGFDFSDPSDPPAAYNRDGYPTRFLGSHLSRHARFRVALAPGDYRVSLYMGGYWRSYPGPEQHLVEFNGERLVEESSDWTETYDLRDYWYFKHVEATLVTDDHVASDRRGYAVYDDYIAPRYRRHDVTVTVSDSGEFANLLEVWNGNGFMSGVVITPVADQAAHDAALADFEATLADDFVTHFANYRPPEEFGLPILQGEYQPTADDQDRGYVIFQRHWMDFVEFNSRPEPGDLPVAGLSVAATPGEFEPTTFSIWPQQELPNAAITVGDLQTADGSQTISGDAVRVWYLQQKPRRDGTTFSFVGVYLPDWGPQRTLYPDVTQRAWLNVKVPEDATPGLYTGQVTFSADGVPPTVLDLSLEVRPFLLQRPPHVRSLRGAGGSKLILNYPSSDPNIPGAEDPPIHNREYYRSAAYADLRDHGFMPDISPYFSGGLTSGWWDAEGNFVWSYGTIAGSGDDQLDRFEEFSFVAPDTLWIDGNMGRVLRAFEGDPGAEWGPAEIAQWLAGIEAEIHGERGIGTIFLHATAEESHYEGSAWTDYLDFVRAYRETGYQGSGAWPHVFTAHTSNTNAGQPEAIEHADFPFLGMFHGVSVPAPSEQVAAAKAAGKPFGLYGMRGRFGSGYFTWKSGATGSYHEFYDVFAGVLNDDWDSSNPETGENPGWTLVTYSQTGRMVGTWYWEELREGVDDDAYMATLDHWIALYGCEADPVGACGDAVAARQAVVDAIDLDALSAPGDPEQLGTTGRYSRMGLSLDRPIEPEVFDSLRSQAAAAIAGLLGPDSDGDWTPDAVDNWPDRANPGQEDADGNGTGDACNDAEDADGDEWADALDNCAATSNPGQEDSDADTLGDVCDPDRDGDGLANEADNCPGIANEDQADLDEDETGDVCDPDRDGDGALNETDNCPLEFNAAQDDTDSNGTGDVCNDAEDSDGDEWADSLDNCQAVANPMQEDADFDGFGNHCDADFNGNGLVNVQDFSIFSTAYNSQQGDGKYLPAVDSNANGLINVQDYSVFSQQYNAGQPGPSGLSCQGVSEGEAGFPCQSRSDDGDGDGPSDSNDNCPAAWNPAQTDTDADTVGNTCDADDDGDGLPDDVETGSGVYVDANDTGSDPLDPDSDGDGVSDGAEVALGTDPNNFQAPGVPVLSPLASVGLAFVMFFGVLATRRRR